MRMETPRELRQGLSRRELMKRGLRTGAYAAPVVLASVIVAPVAAQTVSRPATATPIPGTPTLTANAGTTPQSATVNTAFATPLSVTVRDGSGNPVSGAVVTFTITTAGAGGTFAGGATTVTATTNASGVATAPALTANGTTGTFTVTATTPSVATPAVFTLTNTSITLTANAGTTPQSAFTGTVFGTPLSVTVQDSNGNPVSGVVVTFTVSNRGGSGIFAVGASTVATVTSNISGIATAPILIAGSVGSFVVTATASGGVTPAVFNLAATSITVAANAGTTPQSAFTGTVFGTPLSVTVRDTNGNPVSGAFVTFVIINGGAGAGGTFAGGAATVTVTSNINGVATASALTANGVTGSFVVSANVVGIGMPVMGISAGPVTFNLTNTPAVTQPVPFFQDFILGGGINGNGTIGQLAPNTAFTVFYRPSNTNTFTPAGTVTTDAYGIGFVTIPITNLDATMVSSIQLVATVPGQMPSIIPANNVVSFTSTIITLFALPSGSPRPAASLLGLIIQEQTTMPVGGVANITDIVDVGIFNSTANTAFDIYIQPNGAGAFTRVTTAITNAQGNITTIVPVMLTNAALATTFVLNVVPAGAAPTAAVLTTTLTTPATVRTLPFTSRLAAIAKTVTDVPGAGLRP